MKQALALTISIVLGLLAVFAMRSYIEREKAVTETKVDQVEVLFTKVPLSAQMPLSRNDVMTKFLPSDAVTPDMVKPHEVIEVEGKLVQREINRGGPLFHSDFLRARRENLSSVSVGRRLVSLPVNQVSGVSGLIRPGDRVDVLYTGMGVASERTRETSTEILIENITVHATDSNTVDQGTRSGDRRRLYSTLTLSVTSKEAAILTGASQQGKLTFMIRSKLDFEPSTFNKAVSDTDLSELAKEANAERWKAGAGTKKNSLRP